MSDNEKLAADLVDGLRKLADFIESNPQLAPRIDFYSAEFSAYVRDAEMLGTYARNAAGAGAEVVKEFPPDDEPFRHFRLYVKFGPVSLRMHCEREVVCERVVVGTKTVTNVVQDPEVLAAVPVIEVTEEVEIVEWQCKPLLAAGSES